MKYAGKYLSGLRKSKQITLRQFCKDLKLDASNWSKAERGLMPISKEKKFFDDASKYLSLDENDKWFLARLIVADLTPKHLKRFIKIED